MALSPAPCIPLLLFVLLHGCRFLPQNLLPSEPLPTLHRTKWEDVETHHVTKMRIQDTALTAQQANGCADGDTAGAMTTVRATLHAFDLGLTAATEAQKEATGEWLAEMLDAIRYETTGNMMRRVTMEKTCGDAWGGRQGPYTGPYCLTHSTHDPLYCVLFVCVVCVVVCVL